MTCLDLASILRDSRASRASAKDAYRASAAAQGDGEGPGLRRIRLSFTGEVQGVGFRWTARIVAERVGCSGWVRNECDGSVSMELQGTNEQISAWFGGFAGVYAHRPLDYRIARKEDVEPVRGERGFAVRF
ncbi:acylphosphatase [Olsenella sp. HMSC062G07]|uniref:acylphosphatase n=1 Tax=Olsenella sp. HMSC062G07 TaxID=1739330 RepID=UPI0009F21203|nr:acylphosphatase [Olsenella sp. HMSC062G07]